MFGCFSLIRRLIRSGFRNNCGRKSWAISHNSNPDQFHVLLHRLASMHKPVVLMLIFGRPSEHCQISVYSLHDQSDRKKDIEEHVRSAVYSERNMRWRDEDRKLVAEIKPFTSPCHVSPGITV